MSEKTLRILCIVLSCAICVTLIWGIFRKDKIFEEAYNDGIEEIDINSIYLTGNGIRVDFSEVILGPHKETRKLIVITQEATITTTLTDSMIKSIDWDLLKKTQDVSYTGTGYFVVDLDTLTKDNIIDDVQNKTLTIQIDHAYLQDIVIDPYKIMTGDVKQTLFARGKIKMTMDDYVNLEQEIIKRLKSKFNTAANGQKADTTALQMVKEIYEPLIKAIDPSYTVCVEFK